MPLKVIYDGNDIQVLMDVISDVGVVYSFSGFEAHLSEKPAYGNGFIQKIGFTGVFFISKISQWWQSPELEDAILCASKHTEHYKIKITYGQSMGGYGALLSSGKLKSFSLVTAPQTTITTHDVPLHPVWKDHIQKFPLIRDNILDELENSLGCLVIYDPLCDLDKKHFNYISNQSNISSIIVPFGSHYIPKCLTEMGIFSEIIKELMWNKDASVQEIRKKIRSKRILSPTYVNEITRAVVKRNSKHLKKIVYEYFIKCLSNEDYTNFNLNHVFTVIASEVLTSDVGNFYFKLGSYILNSPNHHTRFIEDSTNIFKAVGNDPQFIFKLLSESLVSSIDIEMYSSVECEAMIYYTCADSPEAFNQTNVLRHPVKQGLNKLRFKLNGIKINPTLRFDPLKQEGGVFQIKSISTSLYNAK